MINSCDAYDLGIEEVDHKATFIDIKEDTEPKAPSRFIWDDSLCDIETLDSRIKHLVSSPPSANICDAFDVTNLGQGDTCTAPINVTMMVVIAEPKAES